MKQIRIGIVGCGAIAQIQHLPNLRALSDAFRLAAVCDVSGGLVRQMAAQYDVEDTFTDIDEMLAGANLDAVLLCQTDPKIDAARKVLAAGKHLFIEKPVAFVPEDVDELVEAANHNRVVAQAGYMKIFDPAFQLLETEVESLRASIRFVQINHLHTNNAHHLAAYDLVRPTDLFDGSSDAQPNASSHAAARLQQVREADALRAIGEVSPGSRRAFFHLAGSMIHDLYGLRHLFGPPDQVASTEVWNGGLGITTVLRWNDGPRCAATWVELERIRHFRETLEIYSGDRGVILSYPTGFSRGMLSEVTLRAVDDTGSPYQLRPGIDWESPFVAELRHFHACITQNEVCRTPLAEARHDVQLVVDITRAGLES